MLNGMRQCESTLSPSQAYCLFQKNFLAHAVLLLYDQPRVMSWSIAQAVDGVQSRWNNAHTITHTRSPIILHDIERVQLRALFALYLAEKNIHEKIKFTQHNQRWHGPAVYCAKAE